MAKKRILYFNQTTGDVVYVSKQHAKKLPEDWKQIEFGKNEQGEPRMRFKFNGATVDVLENKVEEVKPSDEVGVLVKDEIPEGEIVEDGDTNTN